MHFKSPFSKVSIKLFNESARISQKMFSLSNVHLHYGCSFSISLSVLFCYSIFPFYSSIFLTLESSFKNNQVTWLPTKDSGLAKDYEEYIP